MKVIDERKLRRALEAFFMLAYAKADEEGKVLVPVPWSNGQYKHSGLTRTGAQIVRQYFIHGQRYDYPLLFDEFASRWYLNLRGYPTVECACRFAQKHVFSARRMCVQNLGG